MKKSVRPCHPALLALVKRYAFGRRSDHRFALANDRACLNVFLAITVHLFRGQQDPAVGQPPAPCRSVAVDYARQGR